MNKYRTHNCSELNETDVEKTVLLLSGEKYGNVRFSYRIKEQ